MGHRIAKHVMNASNQLEKSTYYVLDAQGNTMAVYEREVDAANASVTFTQEEKYIYGSARLGALNDSIPLLGTQNDSYSQTSWIHTIGQRTYELSNHLGNVLSVISDKPIPHDNGNGTADYFMADIRQAQDYSPFGVTLYGRNFTASGADGFRFGFQGQEMDDEIKGKGNSVNYTFRMHDPRIGRFFAIDPLTKEYPWYTPYQFSGNKVIQCIELEGLEEYIVNVTIEQISEQIFNPELEKTFATPGIKIKVTLTYVKSSERHPLKDDKGDEIKGSENREVDVYIGGVMLENHKIPSNSIYAILRDQKFKTSNESGGSVDMRTLKEAMESGNNVKKIYEGPQGKMMDRLVANFDEHTIFQVSIFYGSDKSVNSGNNEAKEIENLTKLMIQYPFLKLSIEASTDRVGSEADNMKLSTSRATNIMTGVLNLGKGQINKDRITAKGLGEQPAINRKDPDGSENPVLRRTKITPKI